jgi:hypothetical protein
MDIVTWQGTDDEFTRLYNVVIRNCECIPGYPRRCCGAHALLAEQSVLDRLLWVFRTREAFIAREFEAQRFSGN